MNDDADFEIGDVVQARCPIDSQPIDVYDDTRPLMKCNICGKLVHADCYESLRNETGREYQCCNEPSWESLDTSMFVHQVETLKCFIKDDPIDFAEERTILKCGNCDALIHQDCYDQDKEPCRRCGMQDFSPLDDSFIIHWMGQQNDLT